MYHVFDLGITHVHVRDTRNLNVIADIVFLLTNLPLSTSQETAALGGGCQRADSGEGHAVPPGGVPWTHGAGR